MSTYDGDECSKGEQPSAALERTRSREFQHARNESGELDYMRHKERGKCRAEAFNSTFFSHAKNNIMSRLPEEY